MKGDPIELLMAIKQHACSYQEHCFEMSIIVNTMKTLMNLRQKKNESLQDYTGQFKAINDVFVLHIDGPSLIEITKHMHG